MKYPITTEQRTFMDTCHMKGNLYAFFLEISKSLVYDILHIKLNVPANGGKMYKYLKKRFGNENAYKEEINKLEFLLDYQRKELLPRDGKMKLEEMDVTIYMVIIKLVGGKAYADLVRYMSNLRNELCHVSFISLKKGMSEKDFKNDLRIMIYNFKNHGANIAWLDMCKEDILKRIKNDKTT